MDPKEKAIRLEMLGAPMAQQQMAALRTKILCLAVIRGSLDTILMDDIERCKQSTEPNDVTFAKHMEPLVANLPEGPVQMALNGAFEVFAKEPVESRMQTMEDMLKLVFRALMDFSASIETGKEFVDGQESTEEEVR